jgi:hypothetical protein
MKKKLIKEGNYQQLKYTTNLHSILMIENKGLIIFFHLTISDCPLLYLKSLIFGILILFLKLLSIGLMDFLLNVRTAELIENR